jgi:hypothetical protein
METRQNTPNLDMCAGLLATALEFSRKAGFEPNRAVPEPTAQAEILPEDETGLQVGEVSNATPQEN